jgi:hypothetical protein
VDPGKIMILELSLVNVFKGSGLQYYTSKTCIYIIKIEKDWKRSEKLDIQDC